MKKILAIILVALVGLAFTAGTYKKEKKQAIKKERAMLKRFNENDPKTASDNTVTVIMSGREIEMPVAQKLSKPVVSPFERRNVNLIRTYQPETGEYTVTDIEPFMD